MCDFINLGDGCSAIICGGPSDHVCNEDGIMYETTDGERHYIKPEQVEQFAFTHEIRSGSVCCSICGHAAIDDVYKIDI